MRLNAKAEPEASEYVELKPPSAVQNVENAVQFQFAIKLDATSPDNQLLYYGDGTVMKCSVFPVILAG